MINPNKYLRKAYIEAFAAIGVPVWEERVPPNVDEPAKYVLISSQTKDTTERSKDDFEWVCRIQIDIYINITLGYSKWEIVDDIEENCITAIEAGIIVENFYVKSIYEIHSVNLPIDTKTETTQRRVLLYEHWLCQR